MSVPLLSIIAPVYNVAPYLRRCLDSVLQSVASQADNCEIILVDDGSGDESPTIVDEYAKAHPSLIRAFHKQNEGAYPTRNFGMDKAEGTYLWFIDPDDYVEQTAVSEILSAIKKWDNPDILLLRYRRVTNTEQLPFENVVEREVVVTGTEYMNACAPNPYLWAEVFNHQFLLNNALRFNNNLHTQGDWLFSTYAYCKAQRVCRSTIYAYNYYISNPTSTLQNPDPKHRRRAVANSLIAIKEFHPFVEQSTQQPYYKALRSQESIFMAGFLYSLYRMKLSIDEVKTVIRECKDGGYYPAPYGRNKRGNKFLRFANRSWIFLPVCWLHSLRGKLPKA